MKIIDDKPWFAPKLVGVGSGFPIAWQGWVVLAVFLAGMIASSRYLTGAARVIAICLLIAGFGIVAARKTDGGWRWRNGSR